ncbi:MAG: hypothetical protein R3B09_04205 [Nannocystaceae bacterium]
MRTGRKGPVLRVLSLKTGLALPGLVLPGSALPGLALALALGVAAPAAAAEERYGVVTIDLRPEHGEVPTHLCVVSEVAGPRTRNRLSEYLSPGPGEPSEDGRTWDVLPQAWGAKLDPGAGQAPGACGQECRPRVVLPSRFDRASELFVACTADSLSSDDAAVAEPRLLVMMLEHLEGSPPSIESVALAGGVVTIGVQGALRRIVVTARSLGGHYEAQRRSARAEGQSGETKLVLLPLQPRCQWSELVLPGVRLRQRDRPRLTVQLDERPLDVEGCVDALAGDNHLRVRLPRTPPGRSAAIAVALSPDAGGEGAMGHFGGRWDGPWPPSQVTLRAHQVTFSWRPPECVYPTGVCPRAEIEAGIQCGAARAGDVCNYTCPEKVDVSDPVALTPPLTVTFEKDDPRQRWTDILSRGGQTLGSYVVGDAVYVHADIKSWRRDVPGARIRSLEVLGGDGSVRRFPVDGVDRLQIPLASATCEPLRAKVIGDRVYQEELAPIRGGMAELGPPEKRARIMTFNLLLAQGGSISLIHDRPESIQNPSFFVVLGQLSARFRPRRPKLARLSAELRLGGTLGQWGYYGIDSVDDPVRRTDGKPLWVRFLFEPAIVVDVVHPLSLSAGLGIGGSWPLRAEEVQNTSRFAPVYAPSLDARLAVRPWLSLVLQARVFLGERLQATFRDGAVANVHSLQTTSMTGLYGLLFSF